MFHPTRTAAALACITLSITACASSTSEKAIAEAPATTEARATVSTVVETLEEELGCVYPIKDDDSCVLVTSVGGEIIDVEPYPDGMAKELHLACVYQEHSGACEVLAFVGPGDGISAGLTQMSTEALTDDCAVLTGIDQDLACAELATRS